MFLNLQLDTVQLAVSRMEPNTKKYTSMLITIVTLEEWKVFLFLKESSYKPTENTIYIYL
jgi:hypothetical protein